MNTVTLRRFRNGDEFAVSDVICTTLAISNRKDYSPEFIEENIRSHSPEVVAAIGFGSVSYGHFYRGRMELGWTLAVLTAAQLALAVMNVRLLKKISETDEEEPS